ncbi:hypothetical protein AB0N65_20295 [Paenarthrobacter sp. NPDC089322]|uniref:hypothetical protein n=1 Tax=Paenarthrobacter sp. NPDC089322 TaxID=3155065 RepID=UPI00344257E3
MMLSPARQDSPDNRPINDCPGPAERAFLGTALGAFGLVGIVGALSLILHMVMSLPALVGSLFDGWVATTEGTPLAPVRWFFGDMTEPLFYKSELAACGLIVGAALAWWTGRRRRNSWSELSYGTGLWPWVLTSAALSLLLSNLAFGWMLDDGWQPTFVPFVCVAPAMVLMYGRGWRTALTAAILGAGTTTPLALLLIPTVSAPLGLPPVVACVLAMSLGSVVSFAVARRIPWLDLHQPGPRASSLHAQPGQPSGLNQTAKDAAWAARRVLKDFTETHFFANEMASIGVIAGVSLACLLNPAVPAYGSGLVPHILFSQVLTSAVGVVLWRHWYRGDGWAATYAPVVSVAPAAVLAFDGSWQSILGGALLGALLAPPLARAISARLPAGFHPVIGNTASMAVSTAVALPILGLLHR